MAPTPSTTSSASAELHTRTTDLDGGHRIVAELPVDQQNVAPSTLHLSDSSAPDVDTINSPQIESALLRRRASQESIISAVPSLTSSDVADTETELPEEGSVAHQYALPSETRSASPTRSVTSTKPTSIAFDEANDALDNEYLLDNGENIPDGTDPLAQLGSQFDGLALAPAHSTVAFT